MMIITRRMMRSFWVTVKIDYTITIAKLSDWLKNPTLVSQPMRNKTKTNRILYAIFSLALSKLQVLVILIGSSRCLLLFWLLGVITFVLVWTCTTVINLDTRALLFCNDWGREDLWGTLKQASFSLVFAKNQEHAHDWFILFRAKMKTLLSALPCERRLLQICERGKAFWCWKFWLLI